VGLFGIGSGSRSYVKIRLLHLPCPVAKLKRFSVTYDFDEHTFTADGGFRFANRKQTVEETRNHGFYVFSALRRLMTDASLINATKLKCFDFWIRAIPRREDTETRVEAVQRVLGLRKARSTTAERLAQVIFSWGCVYADLKRGTNGISLAVFGGRSLDLLICRNREGCRDQAKH
jgi:hypothetical protein